jgi:DNA-binding SARP family transcriptional activator
MEVNVLGPLEVFRDGVLATPSAPKLRRVLSLLAISANNVVRTHQLIEELWEEDPPASVITTLQTYVYQLRKLLRLDSSGRAGVYRRAQSTMPALQTSPSGYVLTLSPDGLDSLRFEQLAERGRAEFESGDLTKTASTLAEALRLWRGPVLADMTAGPMLQGEILRLEEIRRNTLEQRIEVDLRLGRHHEMLGELTSIAARQRTHEGFQAKLMLALYRSGRRAEALAIYQRTRAALANELGLDTSDTLQRLHKSILDADRSLDLTSNGSPIRIVKSEPAAQLPPQVDTMAGRRGELSVVRDALSRKDHNGPALVLVNGCPGVGKSTFLVNVAHQARAEYPDGQFYAHLMADGRPADPGEVLAGFLRASGVASAQLPSSTDERSRMFRTWTAGRRVLVVLDDVVSDEQLLPLLPSNADCAVIAASRRRLSTHPLCTVDLRPLSIQESTEMIDNALGAQRIVRDHAAVPELARLCDGLPAMLNSAIAALRLRPHWTIRQLTDRLRSAIPGTVHNALAVGVTNTYQLLDPFQQHAFRTLSCVEGNVVSPADAAGILGIDEQLAENVLESIVEYQLIDVVPIFDRVNMFDYAFLPGIQALGKSLQAETSVPQQHVGSPDWSHPGGVAVMTALARK